MDDHAHGGPTKVLLACPHCKAQMTVLEKDVGRRGKCPSCGKVVAVMRTPDRAAPVERPPDAVARPHPKEAALAQCVLDAVQAGRVAVNRLGTPPARLLAMPLAEPVLGQEVSGSVYAANPFRYLAVSACVDSQELEQATSRLRTIGRLRPESAGASAVRTGYDGHLHLGNPVDCLEQIHDPRQRLLAQVFWPHLDSEGCQYLREDRHIVARRSIHRLRQAAASNGRAGMLATHALAVAYHNLAIACELAYATGHTDQLTPCWKTALGYWREVLGGEAFWEYLREQVQVIDDPRLREEDVEQLREGLPEVVLGFNRLFARAYARTQDAKACNRQLAVIARSGFPEAACRDALIATVRTVTSTRLEPLILRAEDPVEYEMRQQPDDEEDAESGEADLQTQQWAQLAARDGLCPSCGERLRTPRAKQCFQCGASWRGGKAAPVRPANPEAKFSRPQFAHLYEPILAEAREIRDYLVDVLHISEPLVARAEFDRLCEVVLDAINRKIDYDNDDRLRSVLYGILLAKSMLRLPLSAAHRRKLEHNIRSDTDVLYKECGTLPQGFDPAQCWFLGGQVADPDASLELPVHKITGIEGSTVRWQSRKILVPRSELAARIHRGRLSSSELAALADDETSGRIRGEIDEVRRECTRQTGILEQDRDKRAAEQRSVGEKRLGQYNRQVAVQEQRDKQYVAQVEAQLNQRVSAETSRFKQASAEVTQSLQPSIDAAQNEFLRVSGEYRGLGSALQVELPMGGALAVILVLVGLPLAHAGLLPAVGFPGLLPLLGVGGSCLACLGMGQWVRRRILIRLREPLTRLTTERDARLAQLSREAQETIADLRQEADRQLSVQRARLADTARQRADLQKSAEESIRRVKADAAGRIQSVKAEADRRVAAFEEKLTARVRPKPVSAKHQFPMYGRLKAKGFQDGERPSEHEMNRMVERQVQRFQDSLTQSERMALAVMQQAMTPQQFAELLAALIGMPAPERRRALSGIVPFGQY